MTRKCKACLAVFVPVRAMQAACCPECAITLVRADRTKRERAASRADRKETKAKLEKLKTRGQWQTEAQAAFNAFVRARDAGKPCICCGCHPTAGQATGGAWDAGHYRSRGSAPHLRFDERNVHAQLKQCNRYDSGNVVGYRMGLIARIGLAEVEILESDQTPRRHSIDELQQIKKTYAAKAREIFKAKA